MRKEFFTFLFLSFIFIQIYGCCGGTGPGNCDTSMNEAMVANRNMQIEKLKDDVKKCKTSLITTNNDLNNCNTELKSLELQSNLPLCQQNPTEKEDKLKEMDKEITKLTKLIAARDVTLKRLDKKMKESVASVKKTKIERETELLGKEKEISDLNKKISLEKSSFDCLKAELTSCQDTNENLNLDIEKKRKALTKAKENLMEKDEDEDEDRERRQEVLDNKHNLKLGMTTVEANLKKMKLESKKCEESCLRVSGEEIIWDSTTDEVIKKSVTCAGDETQLSCLDNQTIEILSSSFGHSKGYACRVEQIGGPTDCTITKEDLEAKLDCGVGSSTCLVKAPREGFGQTPCPTLYLNNLEIYYKCK